jgi:hypothetical protein
LALRKEYQMVRQGDLEKAQLAFEVRQERIEQIKKELKEEWETTGSDLFITKIAEFTEKVETLERAQLRSMHIG